MKLKTVYELLARLCEDYKEFSFGVAIGRLVRDLPILPWNIRKEFYERSILTYLNTEYGEVLRQTKDEQTSRGSDVPSKYVWVMWWQGVDAMPDIVRACWEQLTKAVNDAWKLILITEKNYKDYIELPFYIEEKYRNGSITLTHLSDIIRAKLLKTYGGFWIDATMYVGSLPEKIYAQDYYTLHAPGLFPNFVSDGDWSPFFFYAKYPKLPLFNMLDTVFSEYWKRQSLLIDYLLVDFAIKMIINSRSELKEQIMSIPVNRDYYLLNLAINEPYDAESARDIIERSPLQKLTYKKVFIDKDESGHVTNYQKLISGSFLNE